ncbi:hypothetical protein ACWGB8_05285 [Kitasatospora sp. NPDC054939]
MSEALPPSEVGEDPSGLVGVTIDASGLPETVTVAAPWKNRIRPQDLAAAVLEASRAAGMRRMESWARELDSSGATRADHPGERSTDHRDFSGTDPRQDPPSHAVDGTRPLGEVLEELLDVATQVESATTPALLDASGAAANRTGTVSVTLGVAGLRSVDIDAG